MIARWFLWLGGASEEILERYPTERLRMSITGGAVMTTGCVAAVAATVTTRSFLHAGWILAVVCGLAWGAAITTFDRWMLMSIRRQPSLKMTLVLAAPRVALAITCGFVFAKPIEMIAFNHEVTRQAQWAKKEQKLGDLAKADAYYTPRISGLVTQQQHLVQDLETNPSSTALQKDPVYAADVRRAALLQTEAQKAITEALCELDGTCGTKHAGAGPVYEAKLASADQLKQEAAAAQQAAQARARTLENSAQSAQTSSRSAETTSLSQVDRRLASERSAENADDAGIEQTFKAPIGLADRLAALATVEDSNLAVRLWTAGLTALILLIDAGPVLGKALLLLGPPTPYERELERQEEVAFEVGDAVGKAAIEAANESAAEVVDQAKLHRELWKDELADLLPMIVATQREITEQAIRDWEREARRYAQQPRQYRAEGQRIDERADATDGRGAHRLTAHRLAARLRQLRSHGPRGPRPTVE